MTWTPEKVARAAIVVGKTTTLQEASEALSKEFKEKITRDSLRNALRHYSKSPISLQRSKGSPQLSELAQKLVATSKGNGSLTISKLCDRLNVWPAKLRELVEECQAHHISITVENDKVGIQPSEALKHIQEEIPPIVGKVQRVGVISDIHFGSKYVLRSRLKEFIHYAYEELGIREILCPGDVLEGCYRHAQWELSHSGIEAQAEDAFESLPQKPGLKYRMITGNHDFTFTNANGVEVGPFLVNFFKERGRDDLHFYGNRGAFLKVGGAVVHLWHPMSGASYAISYQLQKKIESYAPGEKPHIVLAGHWHRYGTIEERGVHAIACPTFQGGGSAFSKSLTNGAPAIGGLILEWQLTKDGTMRSFKVERRSYFEKELPVEVR